MDTNKKQIGTFILILAIIGLMFTFLPKGDENGDQPPKLNINFSISTSKFSGATSIACMLPGIRYTEEDVLAYAPAVEFPEPEENNLRNGDHLYFAKEDMTVSEIFANIVPKAGNKVLLAYYPNGRAALGDDFYLYPGVEGNKEITNPETFTIPSNHGFVLFSCLDSKILKVRSEDMDAFDLPEGLAVADNTWFLTSVADLTDLERYSDTLAAIYYQNAPGLAESFAELEEDGERDDAFNMVWLKLDSEEVASMRPIVLPRPIAIVADPASTIYTEIPIDHIEVNSGGTVPSATIYPDLPDGVNLEDFSVFYHLDGETTVHEMPKNTGTASSPMFSRFSDANSKVKVYNLSAGSTYNFALALAVRPPSISSYDFVPFTARPAGAVNTIPITSTDPGTTSVSTVSLFLNTPEWANMDDYEVYYYLDGSTTVREVPHVTTPLTTGTFSTTLSREVARLLYVPNGEYNFVVADRRPSITIETFTPVTVAH